MYNVDMAYDGVDDIGSKSIQRDFLVTLFDRGLNNSTVTLQCLKNRTLSATTENYQKAHEIANVMKTSIRLFGGKLI